MPSHITVPEPAVVVSNLAKEFQGERVLEDLSFEIEPGLAVALVGPNGAGKTTLFRLLLGLLGPDQGSIAIFGQPSHLPAVRQRIGFCLDNDGLYQGLDARANIDFFRIAYGQPKVAADYLKTMGVENFDSKRISRYSRGMRKRLAVARSLVCDPQLLLLDEPLLGLDPDGQEDLAQFLRTAKKDRALLVSSHDLSSVADVCDRIIVLNRKILFDGPVAQFRTLGATMFDAYKFVLATGGVAA